MSGRRYSTRPSAAVPPALLLELGVTSKAPAPIATRGGSLGDPSVSCAAAGWIRRTVASRQKIAPASAGRTPVIDNVTPAPLRLPCVRRILEAIMSAASETA